MGEIVAVRWENSKGGGGDLLGKPVEGSKGMVKMIEIKKEGERVRGKRVV